MHLLSSRLDWNLLSTATPAINAWLSPFDRLMISIRTLVLTLTHRTSTVMACVMTDALEVPGIQLPYRVNMIYISVGNNSQSHGPRSVVSNFWEGLVTLSLNSYIRQ